MDVGEKLDVMDYCPSDSAIMVMGWLGALRFALGHEGIVAAFRKDTGNRWTPPKSPLDRMVDSSTARMSSGSSYT